MWTDTLRQIKEQRPQTGCIILIITAQQQQAAQVAGADTILIKGFSTAELFAAIKGFSSLVDVNSL